MTTFIKKNASDITMIIGVTVMIGAIVFMCLINGIK